MRTAAISQTGSIDDVLSRASQEVFQNTNDHSANGRQKYLATLCADIAQEDELTSHRAHVLLSFSKSVQLPRHGLQRSSWYVYKSTKKVRC